MKNVLETRPDGTGLRIAIVASRFHDFLVDKLIEGAQQTLIEQGVSASALHIVRVPGSFELPLACKELAQCKKFNALVALGILLRGGTKHFDLISSSVTQGINQVSLEYSLPIGFGVISAETLEQAVERAGGKIANRGIEAALAALHMANLQRNLREELL